MSFEMDMVSYGVALLLALMSVSSWAQVLRKGLQSLRWRAACRAAAAQLSQQDWQPAHGAHALLLSSAQEAAQLAEHASPEQRTEVITRSLRRSLLALSAQLEAGLTLLASVGSVAPFVGLLGTVWGIYHALAGMAAAGSATLASVAGPVGEALVMTAAGLFVAIPAVLAYNAYVRLNRLIMAELESYAQELLTRLTLPAREGFSPRMVKGA